MLPLDCPVCEVWPRFAEGGKEHVTFAHVLSHTAGLCLLDAPAQLRAAGPPRDPEGGLTGKPRATPWDSTDPRPHALKGRHNAKSIAGDECSVMASLPN